MGTICLVLAAVSAIWGIICGMAMTSYLARRGNKVSYVWIRLFIFKYIQQYRSITLKETGKPGPLFYQYLFCMNFALVMAIVGLVLLAM